MLIGEYEHTLDPKGRMIFPAKLREELGESFVLTRGLDGCLFVYSILEWKLLEEKVRSLPMSKTRDLQRFLFASAVQVEPDKQGRILIPQNLRRHAGLQKDAVVIGASVRAEIWDREKWEALCENLTEDSIAQTMEELGF
ncbi:MAG: division/cell wall cluster transcriptional repressor MraZ [Oscillospiraceae bacterium]